MITSLPDLHLHLLRPDGSAVATTIVGLGPDTTVGELARLVTGRTEPLVIDGRCVPASTRVAATPIRHGSTVEPARSDASTGWNDGRGPAVAGLRCVGGPDTGRVVELRAGRVVLGSSPTAACSLADPGIAGHHALLDVTPAGGVEITGLGLGRPLVDRGGPADGWRFAIGDTRLAVTPPGGSPSPSAGPRRPEAPGGAAGRRSGGRPWTDPVVRRASDLPTGIVPVRPAAPVNATSTGPTGIGLATSLVSLIGGVAAAVVFHQVALLAVTAIGALGVIVTGGVQSIRSRRAAVIAGRAAAADLARVAAEVEAQRRAARRLHSATVPWSYGALGGTVTDPWQDSASDNSAFRVVLGWGDVEWQPVVVAPDERSFVATADGSGGGVPLTVLLDDVGVPLVAAAGSTVAVLGPADRRNPVARSIVLQLAVRLGPSELTILVVTAAPLGEEWAWARWLPHAAGTGGVEWVVTPAEFEHSADLLLDASAPADAPADPSRSTVGGAAPRAVLLVLDGIEPLGVRTSAVRRFLDRYGSSVITIALGDDSAPVPAACDTVVRVDGHHGELDRIRRAGATVQRFEPMGVPAPGAAQVARALAGLDDAEAADDQRRIPEALELLELLGPRAVSAAAIASHWEQAGTDPPPATVLGRAADGLVELDLGRDGPHALVAGTTGSGKSELLRSLVLGLAAASPPEQLTFVLVDYKGGSAFDGCSALPHVVGSVTDLDDRLAARMLASLDAELRRRERRLRAAGVADLTAYRASRPTEPMARLVVIVDEFAALAAELPDFLSSLVAVAQRGRSLGVHLVLATQRPAGVVSDDIRANTNLRLCLRVQDPADGLDVLGDRLPARLPRRLPGRAAVRLGADDPVVFQAARCTGPATPEGGSSLRLVARWTGSAVQTALGGATGSPGPTSLDVLVERISMAAGLRRSEAGPEPVRPWVEPLPDRLDDRGDPTMLGEVDLVSGQRREPLVWDRSTGHLLVCGRVGAGTTSTLSRLAVAFTSLVSPAELHLHVLDGADTAELAPLTELPHCGGVVPATDRERLGRLLRRLDAAIGAASDRSGGPTPAHLLLVDGVASLRASLADPDALELTSVLDRLVAEGPRAGLAIAFAADQASALPMAWLSRCPNRWIGRVADPLDATLGGLPASAALVHAPAGRFVVGLDGERPLDAHVASSERSLADQCAGVVGRWAGAAGGPPTIGPAPDRFSSAEVAAGSEVVGGVVHLAVGVRVGDREPVRLSWFEGEHALVIGPARSGRSTALALVREQWTLAVPGSMVVPIEPRRMTAAGIGAALQRLRDGTGPAGPVLITVDDADRFDDAEGALLHLLNSERVGLHVLAAARPDGLRAAGHGHWTNLVRRSRTGLLLGAVQDHDPDLLGVHVPRRLIPRGPVAPGRGLFVADGRCDAVHLAVPAAEAVPAPDTVPDADTSGPAGAPARSAPTGSAARRARRTQRGAAVAGSSGQKCLG